MLSVVMGESLEVLRGERLALHRHRLHLLPHLLFYFLQNFLLHSIIMLLIMISVIVVRHVSLT